MRLTTPDAPERPPAPVLLLAQPRCTHTPTRRYIFGSRKSRQAEDSGGETRKTGAGPFPHSKDTMGSWEYSCVAMQKRAHTLSTAHKAVTVHKRASSKFSALWQQRQRAGGATGGASAWRSRAWRARLSFARWLNIHRTACAARERGDQGISLRCGQGRGGSACRRCGGARRDGVHAAHRCRVASRRSAGGVQAACRGGWR